MGSYNAAVDMVDRNVAEGAAARSHSSTVTPEKPLANLPTAWRASARCSKSSDCGAKTASR
jgi:hypothetical protein